MTAAEMDRWLERTRSYGRAYAERWRAELAADPERHAAYLELMAEYRRRRRLRRLVAIGAEMMERL